jgi:hypothetical protein
VNAVDAESATEEGGGRRTKGALCVVSSALQESMKRNIFKESMIHDHRFKHVKEYMLIGS